MVVLVTAPRTHASQIAAGILEARLAACVNVVSGLRSHYWWRGELRRDEDESLLLVKTVTARLAHIEALLRQIHPYELFEVVALPVAGGHAPYLEWIAAEAAPRG